MVRRLIPCLLVLVLAAGAAAATRSPLVDAAKHGDLEAVRTLLQKHVDVNAAEADGATALIWASYRDDLEMADLLLGAGARVNAATDLGVTPLWSASENGSEPMVRRLLRAGANPNAKLLLGETPAMVASRAGSAAVVEQLLASGAQVNARAARGQTALMWAVSQKHPDVVKVLLAHRADVHARSDVWTEVMAVPPHGYLDYNRPIPHGGETALMFAARVGDLGSANLLVAAGADVNDLDASGVSAAALAAHAGYRYLVAFLLDRGADPNAARAGFSALHAAIMRRDEKMIEVLLVHGADSNAPVGAWTPTRRSSRDFHFSPELVGATPFWLAARFGGPRPLALRQRRGVPRMTVDDEHHRLVDPDDLSAALAARQLEHDQRTVDPCRGAAIRASASIGCGKSLSVEADEAVSQRVAHELGTRGQQHGQRLRIQRYLLAFRAPIRRAAVGGPRRLAGDVAVRVRR